MITHRALVSSSSSTSTRPVHCTRPPSSTTCSRSHASSTNKGSIGTSTYFTKSSNHSNNLRKRVWPPSSSQNTTYTLMTTISSYLVKTIKRLMMWSTSKWLLNAWKMCRLPSLKSQSSLMSLSLSSTWEMSNSTSKTMTSFYLLRTPITTSLKLQHSFRSTRKSCLNLWPRSSRNMAVKSSLDPAS